MAGQCETKLAMRNYSGADEQSAFRLGYSDGWWDEEFGGSHQQEYPNTYAAGYWEGKGDAS